MKFLSFLHVCRWSALVASLALAGACSGDATAPLATGQVMRAATFPAEVAWVPLLQSGVGIGDPSDDGANNAREIVGDEFAPAMFVHTNGDDFFVRLRLDVTPAASDGVRPFGWGVLIDTDGDFSAYEFLIMVDGTGADQVAFAANTSPETTGSPNDDAETDLPPYPEALVSGDGGNVRITEAETSFNGDPDFYLDIAVSLATMREVGLDLNTPVAFIGGTSNSARAISVDLAGTAVPPGPGTLAVAASDEVYLDGSSADPDGDGFSNDVDVDDDNDGIPDVRENLAGLDPDGDNDGDGIPNWRDASDRGDGSPAVCSTSADGSTCVTLSTLYDSDGDGRPNHLDVDSDDDGLLDSLEAGHTETDDDGDGLLDGPYGANGLADEVETAPDSGAILYSLRDTDGDELPDFLDLDSDGDLVFDVVESGSGALDGDGDGRIDAGADADADGLRDVVDGDAGRFAVPLVDPRAFDEDGDTIPDAYDAASGIDGDSGDSDGDGIDDATECRPAGRVATATATACPTTWRPTRQLIAIATVYAMALMRSSGCVSEDPTQPLSTRRSAWTRTPTAVMTARTAGLTPPPTAPMPMAMVSAISATWIMTATAYPTPTT